MIQIIGWLGCAMLAVKLLEMSSNPVLFQEDGSAKPAIAVALLVGWLSVFGFAFWLLVQGGAFPAQPQATGEVGEQMACLDAAKTTEQIDACFK